MNVVKFLSLFLFIALIALPSANAEPDRIFLDLSGQWRFQTDPGDVGGKSGWQQPAFDDSAWRTLAVPGAWESQGVTETYPGMPCPKLDLPNVPNAYNGAAWYRRSFDLPAEWAGKDLDILIGGVDDLDVTFLNGLEVGRTKEGTPQPSTLPRRYPVPASSVRPGTNTIAIRVWDGGGPGGIHRGPVVLYPQGGLDRLVEAQKKGAVAAMNLRERFQSPPNDRRILKIVHGLPKNEKGCETALIALLVQGFGGIVTNVAFQNYLQDEESWRAFTHGVALARKMGMTVWLYDEQGYPSGAAGGLTLKGHPEWEALGLLAASADSVNGEIVLDLPEGPVVLARAYPLAEGRLDAARGVDIAPAIKDRKLRWSAPPGAWRGFAFVQSRLFENTHASFNLFESRPYINLLMREPVERFIQLTHQAYADRVPDFKQTFEAVFTDEPSLMSVFSDFGHKGDGLPPIPWSPRFAEQFAKEKGYDLIPLLPALFADIGPQTGKVRCDFRDLVGRLVADCYFKQIQDWCRAHGVASSGHPLAEESLLSHCAYYGHFMRCVRHLDFPSIDCLTSIPATAPWHAAKFIGSVANIEGRPKTMSETSDHSQRYRRKGDTRPVYHVTPDEIRGTCNRLYVGGINTTTSYYSWSGIPDSEIRNINEYVGRIGVMLTAGEHVCDIAVYYPIESIWTHFVPAPSGATRNPAALRSDSLFRDASYALFKGRRDFNYVDADVVRRCAVEDGALRIGALAFRILILPCTDTIPLDVWRKVAEFHARGGVVIAVGDIPRNSTEAFPCPEVVRLSESVFGKADEAAGRLAFHVVPPQGAGVFVPDSHLLFLPQVCDAVLEPDLSAADRQSPLRYTHRRLEGRDVYFVINDSESPVEDKVVTCGVGPAELWNPVAGGVAPAAQEKDAVAVKLGPYSSLFLVYEKCRRPALRVADSVSARFEIAETPLRDALGRGFALAARGPAHVACEVTPVQGAVEVRSTIREGDRDCWSFPSMTFDPPADLSRYRGLMFQCDVPDSQSACGASLSVLLTDRSGATYIAKANRSLSVPGRRRSTVWFDAFTLLTPKAPKSAALDLAGVKALAIGWGGYFGKTNEAVSFTVSEVTFLSVR